MKIKCEEEETVVDTISDTCLDFVVTHVSLYSFYITKHEAAGLPGLTSLRYRPLSYSPNESRFSIGPQTRKRKI